MKKTIFAFTVTVCNEWCNKEQPYQMSGILFASCYGDAAEQLEEYFRSELCSIDSLYEYGDGENIFFADAENYNMIKDMLAASAVYKELIKE